MGFCVYHFEKGKGNSSAIGNHIDRAEGKEHSYKNADPNRKHLNQNFIVNESCKKPLQIAISDRIKDGYRGKKAIRKDAVKYLKHILSGSHEDMVKISNDKESLKAWVNVNYRFMVKEFGAENIVRFNLHLDEKTPHLHCVTVPLTEDGKLSAKLVTGDKKALQERQTRYGIQINTFGLERGVKGSKAKHTTLKDYYKIINQEEKTSFSLLTPNIGGFPTIEPPTKMEVIRGKTDEWKANINLQLDQWANSVRFSIEEKTKELAKEYADEIKKKRFKDISLTFAMKHKSTIDKEITSYKNKANEAISRLNNTKENHKKMVLELNHRISDLKVESKERFQKGANAVIANSNSILKDKNLEIKINKGEVVITETLKSKDKPKGLSR
jgi:hypothetical protein